MSAETGGPQQYNYMIRLFKSLYKSLNEENIPTESQIFQKATDEFNHYGYQCPNCKATGKLSFHSLYERGLVSFYNKNVTDSRINPRRLKCASCGTSHALLPDILVPYSPYTLPFMLTVLIAYFERETSVVNICADFGIAVSTLYEWKKRLAKCKDFLLGVVLSLNKPALSFLNELFASDCLSDLLNTFFEKYGFSFLQAMATRYHPP